MVETRDSKQARKLGALSEYLKAYSRVLQAERKAKLAGATELDISNAQKFIDDTVERP